MCFSGTKISQKSGVMRTTLLTTNKLSKETAKFCFSKILIYLCRRNNRGCTNPKVVRGRFSGGKSERSAGEIGKESDFGALQTREFVSIISVKVQS